jgi:L-amino acid N-acyltransferase YncA
VTVRMATQRDAGAIADIYEPYRRDTVISFETAPPKPNPASVALHEALGFKPVGVVSEVGFKNGTWWDVGWWHRRLAGPPQSPQEPQPWSELPDHTINSVLEGATR